MDGMKVASENIHEILLDTNSSRTAIKKQNKKNHQYSGRYARPLKSKYF